MAADETNSDLPTDTQRSTRSPSNHIAVFHSCSRADLCSSVSTCGSICSGSYRRPSTVPLPLVLSAFIGGLAALEFWLDLIRAYLRLIGVAFHSPSAGPDCVPHRLRDCLDVVGRQVLVAAQLENVRGQSRP